MSSFLYIQALKPCLLEASAFLLVFSSATKIFQMHIATSNLRRHPFPLMLLCHLDEVCVSSLYSWKSQTACFEGTFLPLQMSVVMVTVPEVNTSKDLSGDFMITVYLLQLLCSKETIIFVLCWMRIPSFPFWGLLECLYSLYSWTWGYFFCAQVPKIISSNREKYNKEFMGIFN